MFLSTRTLLEIEPWFHWGLSIDFEREQAIMAGKEVHIPTVNIGPLLKIGGESYTEEDRAETASTLMTACQTHGLFFATGHGITTAQRKTAFDNARRFFSLPEAAKRKIPAKKGGFTRGYIGFGGESGSDLLECKEAFSYGYPWPDDRHGNALQGPNIWPESDALGEGWQYSMVELFRLMVSVNEAVARGLSLSPELGLQDLPALCQGGDTISLLRLFHYFPYHVDGSSNDSSRSSTSSSGGVGVGVGGGEKGDGGDEDGRTNSGEREEKGVGKIGSSPHTDWGLSTSILQDGAGGLQFLEQETQRWIDVPCAQEDALVFNCGDYLSLLSNGRLKSPVHQVVTTGVERTSFVFFYYPNFDSKLPAAATPGGAADSSSSSSSTTTTSSSSSTAAASTTMRDGTTAGEATVVPASPTLPPSAARVEDLAAVSAPAGTTAPARTEEIQAETAGSSVTAAAPAVPASKSAAESAPVVAKIGAYNTLLDLKRGDADGNAPSAAGDESFGQYLARKWGAVFRE